jgi:hypothetical protein
MLFENKTPRRHSDAGEQKRSLMLPGRFKLAASPALIVQDLCDFQVEQSAAGLDTEGLTGRHPERPLRTRQDHLPHRAP